MPMQDREKPAVCRPLLCLLCVIEHLSHKLKVEKTGALMALKRVLGTKAVFGTYIYIDSK